MNIRKSLGRAAAAAAVVVYYSWEVYSARRYNRDCTATRKNRQGFEEAANVYFNKSFAQLTEDEYIASVAMIIAPTTFNMEDFPDRSRERVSRIKRLVNGDYKPRGLFDMYYGSLDAEVQKNLPPLSYFGSYYR